MTEEVRTGFWRRLAFAVVGAGMGWIALFSWGGLIEKPGQFIGPAFYGGLMIAALGALLRSRRQRWYVVLLAQLAVLGFWIQHRTSDLTGLKAWIPTPSGVSHMLDVIGSGASALNTYASPVSARHVEAYSYMLVLGLLVILTIDVLAGGLRRAPWAGLPVVVALSVPVSVLEEGLSWIVFAGCALLFVMLLAGDESQRVRTWARKASGSTTTEADPAAVTSTSADAVRVAAIGIGSVATLSALLLPLLVPVGNGIVGEGEAFGPGHGRSNPVKLVNPIIDMRRDLIRGKNVPLVAADTKDTDREYLRTTVLDAFDGERWKPSKRDLPTENRVAGDIPAPPGLDVSTTFVSVYGWDLELYPDFQSAWLPAPYPLQSLVTEGGDWRYDDRTFDFVRVDDDRTPTVKYQLRAMHPEIEADALETAPPAPSRLRDTMTAVPDDLPATVEETARRVTSGAATPYAKAVRLQDWFRRDGGFKYSLENDSGSTTNALVRFITEEKVGYCEQFAAAMAVMARTLGIPARVVVGFLKPDSVQDDVATYTSDGLHAWPEIYFQGTGWVRFEPTPASRSGEAPSWTEQAVVPAPLPSRAPQATVIPAPSTERRALIPDAVKPASTTESNSGRYAAIAVLVVVLIGMILPGLVRRRQRRRRLEVLAGTGRDAAAASLWTELLATATDLGITVPQSRSLRVVAEVLTRAVLPEPADRARLDALVTRLEEARFGLPGTVTADEATQMTDDVRRWIHLLTRSVPLRRRALAKAFPRSVLTRTSAQLATKSTSVQVGAGEIR